jgi:hypothetical protein
MAQFSQQEYRTSDYVVSAYAQQTATVDNNSLIFLVFISCIISRLAPGNPALLAAASELVRRDEAQLVPRNVRAGQHSHTITSRGPPNSTRRGEVLLFALQS